MNRRGPWGRGSNAAWARTTPRLVGVPAIAMAALAMPALGVVAAVAMAAVLLTGCASAGSSVVPPASVGPAQGQGLTAGSPADRAPTGDTRAVQVGVVTNVVDGDTVDVAGAGRIRVIGIDTPERGACGYDSATYAMSDLVLGKEVTLVPGAVDDADRYGRLLRYVDVGGLDAGLSLIEDGWAIARYDSRDGYGRHRREDQYVAADLAAPDLGCYPDDEP